MAQNNYQWNEEQLKSQLASPSPTTKEQAPLPYVKNKSIITKVRQSYRNIKKVEFTNQDTRTTNTDTNEQNILKETFSKSPKPLEEILNSTTYYDFPPTQDPFTYHKKNITKTDYASTLNKTRNWLNFTEEEFNILKAEFFNLKQKFTRSAKKYFYPEVISTGSVISIGEAKFFVADSFRDASIEFLLTYPVTVDSTINTAHSPISKKETAEQLSQMDFMQTMQTFIPAHYAPQKKKTGAKKEKTNTNTQIIFARIGDHLSLTTNNEVIKLLLNHFNAKAKISDAESTYKNGHFINFFPREK